MVVVRFPYRLITTNHSSHVTRQLSLSLPFHSPINAQNPKIEHTEAAAIFPGEMKEGAGVGAAVAMVINTALADAFGKPYVLRDDVTAPLAMACCS